MLTLPLSRSWTRAVLAFAAFALAVLGVYYDQGLTIRNLEQKVMVLSRSPWSSQNASAIAAASTKRVARGSREAFCRQPENARDLSIIDYFEQGNLVWSKTFDYFVHDLVILDDGIASIGYYGRVSRPISGLSPPFETFVASSVASDGSQIAEHRILRRPINGPSLAWTPTAATVLAGFQRSSFIVVLESDIYGDRGFRLLEFVGSSAPNETRGAFLAGDDQGILRARGVYKIPNAPLILIDWLRLDVTSRGGSETGSEVDIYDERFRKVWSVTLRGDYEKLRESIEERRWGTSSDQSVTRENTVEPGMATIVMIKDSLESQAMNYPQRCARVLREEPAFLVYSMLRGERAKYRVFTNATGVWSVLREYVEPI